MARRVIFEIAGFDVMRNSREILPIAIIILALLAATACETKKAEVAAENAVKEFHVLFNEGRYKEIYKQADQTYRQAVSATETEALFELIHEKLGAVQQSKRVGWFVNSSTLGTTVRIEYKTEFTNGNATEQFIFLEGNSDTRLMNYDIRSPLLVKSQ